MNVYLHDTISIFIYKPSCWDESARHRFFTSVFDHYDDTTISTMYIYDTKAPSDIPSDAKVTLRNLSTTELTLHDAISSISSTYILFIEEPVLLSIGYIETLLGLFDHKDVACVQSRIVSEKERMTLFPYPSRGGFTRIINTPIVDGRICMFRRSCYEETGGFDHLCGSLIWHDLSLRLLLFPRLICNTDTVTAFSLQEPSQSLFRSFQFGGDAYTMLMKWRKFIYDKRKPFLAYFYRKVKAHRGFLSTPYIQTFLITWIRSIPHTASAFMGFLIKASNPLKLPKALHYHSRDNSDCSPYAYRYCDDYGIYCSHLFHANYSLLNSSEYENHHTHMSEIDGPISIEPSSTSTPPDLFLKRIITEKTAA